MIFNDEEKQLFRDQGFVIKPGFFNEHEVAAMQAELDRLRQEGKLANVTTEGDGTTPSSSRLNLQLCPMSPHSEVFKVLPFAPKVREAISELIGDPVVLHLDQVFLKPARHGAGTNWHQDNAYFNIPDPLMGTAMWTAVHDATAENGTIRVIPGSHRQKLEHQRDPDSNHHIRCFPSEENAVLAEMKAGGVIFFAYGVAHATGSNNTDRDRAGAAYHFLNGDAVTPEYFNWGGDSMHHPYLTGPKFDGGVAEYGDDLSSTWDSAIDRATA